MGLSLCTQRNHGSHTLSFQITEQWHASEETDEEDEEVAVSFNRVRKCVSMPLDLSKDPMEERRKEENSRVRGYSLTERLKERRHSSVVNREGELLAQKYSNMIKNNTLEHINKTVCVADSIVQKGANINEELNRQERALCKIDKDMSNIKYDTEVTSQTLKGMTSLKGKLASKLSRKKPKREAEVVSEMNFDLLNGQSGLCAFSKTASCETMTATETFGNTQEDQIKAGFGKLHNALDLIKIQQLDTEWTLQKQEGRFIVFEDNLGTTQEKIRQQNVAMNKIMDK